MAFHNVPPNGFPDLPDVEELEAVVKDVADLKTSVSGLSEDVGDLSASIAPEFSTESAYAAGDIVYHDGSLYEFTANHAAGAWNTSDTQAVTVGGKIESLEGNVASLSSAKANKNNIAPEFSEEVEYSAGDLVYYIGSVYRCTNSHEGEWDADDFAATTIDGELASLRSGLTNLGSVLTPSVGTNITLLGGGYTVIGNLVCVNLSISTSDTVPLNSLIVSMIPPAVGDTPISIYDINTFDTALKGRIYINGNVVASESLDANGVYIIVGCYIKAS